jgi:hypothetical protein
MPEDRCPTIFNQICAFNREDRDYDALVVTWPATSAHDGILDGQITHAEIEGANDFFKDREGD